MSPIMFCHVETNPLAGIYAFGPYFLKERIKKRNMASSCSVAKLNYQKQMFIWECPPCCPLPSEPGGVSGTFPDSVHCKQVKEGLG